MKGPTNPNYAVKTTGENKATWINFYCINDAYAGESRDTNKNVNKKTKKKNDIFPKQGTLSATDLPFMFIKWRFYGNPYLSGNSVFKKFCLFSITECLWEDVQEILGQDTRRNLIIIRLKGTTVSVGNTWNDVNEESHSCHHFHPPSTSPNFLIRHNPRALELI